MNDIVLLQNVTKSFKNKTAVDQVSFSIKKGEVVAILGPNGAGKTTTMMMMLGLLKPSSGDVQVLFGHPREKKVRDKIGAMLQEVSVIDALKVREVIQLFRSYYTHPLSFEELVAFTGFGDEDLKKRAEKLSGGQKRRLSFALAMAGDPDLLFLDEPTVGLDITSRKMFWNTIGELKERGKTIIFSTHYLQEADEVARRMILFHQGKVIADGTPQEIKAKLSKKSVSFMTTDCLQMDEWRRLPFISEVYDKEGRIYLVTDNTDFVLAELMKQKLNISGIQIEQGKLDEAFEQLTEEREGVI